MPELSVRKNKRFSVEQRILNNFPIESKARWYRYSVASQIVHPFGAAIEELILSQQRSFYNYFPATYDFSTLDALFHVPIFFEDMEVKAYIDSTNHVTPVELPDNLDEFYNDPLPTRLKLLETKEKVIHPTRAASNLKFGSLYERYSVDSHLNANLFNTETATSWASASGSPTIAYSSTDGWGGGSRLKVNYNSSGTPTSAIKATSTSSTTGDVGFYGQIRTIGTDISQLKITVGVQTVGSSVKTFTPGKSWEGLKCIYSPPSSSSSGVPFVEIETTKNASSTDELNISDFHLFKHSSIHENTSIPYSLRDWSDNNPSRAYVVISGGTNLFDINTKENSPILPSAVTIQGINAEGEFVEERIITPYNGTHPSSNLYKEIIGTRVDSIYPRSAQVQVQLQNYQSFQDQQDVMEEYITSDFEGPLFRSLMSTNGTSWLGFDSFMFDDFTALADGYDDILPQYYIELVNEAGASLQLDDLKVDPLKKHVYALDAANKKILIYDSSEHWPDHNVLLNLNANKSPYQDMIINDFLPEEFNARLNDQVPISCTWRNRDKRLIRNRWTLYKPNGTIVGLNIDGSEVAITNDYWISNNAEADEQGELRFQPQKIEYTAGLYGDYLVVLEAEYEDIEKTEERVIEKDASIFSVVKRSPLQTLSLPTSESRTPIGMDLDNHQIRIAYTNPDTNFIVDEEIYSRLYDYFFRDTESNRIYFREKYDKIIIRRSDEVAFENSRQIVILTADSTLSSAQIDNSFILVKTSGSVITLTLPELGTTGSPCPEDGANIIVKRRGADNVVLNPSGSETIELASSLTLSSNGDSKSLTFINNEKDWILSS